MTDNFSKMISEKASTGTGVSWLGVGRFPEEIEREGNGKGGALTRMGMMWLGQGITGKPLSISSWRMCLTLRWWARLRAWPSSPLSSRTDSRAPDSTMGGSEVVKMKPAA